VPLLLLLSATSARAEPHHEACGEALRDLRLSAEAREHKRRVQAHSQRARQPDIPGRAKGRRENRLVFEDVTSVQLNEQARSPEPGANFFDHASWPQAEETLEYRATSTMSRREFTRTSVALGVRRAGLS
jgi:hypothetical protein